MALENRIRLRTDKSRPLHTCIDLDLGIRSPAFSSIFTVFRPLPTDALLHDVREAFAHIQAPGGRSCIMAVTLFIKDPTYSHADFDSSFYTERRSKLAAQ